MSPSRAANSPAADAAAGSAEVTRPMMPLVAFIQVIRAAAPLLVIWAHLAGFWLSDRGKTWWLQERVSSGITTPLGLYQNAGHMGVILFFLVSGYIVSYISLMETPGRFAVKRLARILPMLIASVAVVWFVRVQAHTHHLPNPPGTTGSSLRGYVGGALLLDHLTGRQQVCTVTWTLVVEAMFYALTASLLHASRRQPMRATLVMLAIWSAGAGVTAYFSPAHYLSYYAVYVGFLIFGRVLFLGHCRIIEPVTTVVILGLTTAITIKLYTQSFPGLLTAPNGTLATYVLSVLVFLVFMFSGVRHVPRPVAFFADISYPVYLLHIPVGMITIDAVMHSTHNFSLAFFVGVAIVIAASALAHYFFDRPIQRSVRRWLRQTPMTSVTDAPRSTPDKPGPGTSRPRRADRLVRRVQTEIRQ